MCLTFLLIILRIVSRPTLEIFRLATERRHAKTSIAYRIDRFLSIYTHTHTAEAQLPGTLSSVKIDVRVVAVE